MTSVWSSFLEYAKRSRAFCADANSTSCVSRVSNRTFTPVYVMTHLPCVCAECVQQTVIGHVHRQPSSSDQRANSNYLCTDGRRGSVTEEMQTTREAKLSNDSRQTVALGRPGIVQRSTVVTLMLVGFYIGSRPSGILQTTFCAIK